MGCKMSPTGLAVATTQVMYANIRHAFFQPAEKEMVSIIHLHLHNPIMVRDLFGQVDLFRWP